MPFYGSAARAPGAERQTRREAMTTALLHRHAPARHQLTAAALAFRGLSLADMAREALEGEGLFERGMSRPEVAQRALQASSDFPLILGNVADRTLRDAYAAAPQTFKAFARASTLSDFRPASRLMIGEAPQLLEVLENGEFKRGSMNEGAETIRLRTYGRVVGITRQVILNDDLGAFTRLPEAFGTSASTLESDLVWGLILSNPTLATDGKALFHTDHRNSETGAGSALSAAAIAAARTSMSKQVGLDGVTLLNVRPSFVAVPPELETSLQQILFGITPNTTAAVVPDSIRSLTPISEPRLSTGVGGVQGSATGWYLFADPAQVDSIEYAHLDGQTGPYTETRNGFDVDGIEVKCRHDFGAAAMDFRGVYRNAGA